MSLWPVKTSKFVCFSWLCLSFEYERSCEKGDCYITQKNSKSSGFFARSFFLQEVKLAQNAALRGIIYLSALTLLWRNSNNYFSSHLFFTSRAAAGLIEVWVQKGKTFAFGALVLLQRFLLLLFQVALTLLVILINSYKKLNNSIFNYFP